MLSDGTLMRLSKQDFIKLLKKNLVRYMNYDLAHESIREGSTWLDVRLADEYAGFSFENSINVPLSMIRERAQVLIRRRNTSFAVTPAGAVPRPHSC